MCTPPLFTPPGHHETLRVREWHIIVNPHLFGGDDIAAWFDVQPATKDELMEQLKLMPGVFVVTNRCPVSQARNLSVG